MAENKITGTLTKLYFIQSTKPHSVCITVRGGPSDQVLIIFGPVLDTGGNRSAQKKPAEASLS